MDQEAHDQGVKLFNQRMFQQEAMQNWMQGGADLDGPGRFAEQRDALAKTAGLTPEQRMQGLQLIDMEEQAEALERSALGYRGRVGELVRRNQDLLELSPVLQGLADPAALESIAPEELPALLQSVEQEVGLLRQQMREDEAVLQMGQRLQTLSNDPALGFGMQEQIPRIIEGMADRYPPQAMNNLLAGLNGEVPMSRLMDGGATEAATRDYLQQRQREAFAQTPEGRALLMGQSDTPGGGVDDGDGPEQVEPTRAEAFLEFQQSLPRTMSVDDRARAIEKWAKENGTTPEELILEAREAQRAAQLSRDGMQGMLTGGPERLGAGGFEEAGTTLPMGRAGSVKSKFGLY